jgi:hypothetical protein
MVSYRYWRVQALGVQSGTNFALAEIEMRATIGGADQCVGGTAIASTTFAGSAASNAFDNSISTWWATLSGSHINGWIGYDFGTPVEVLELSLTARNDSGFSQSPTTFVVEGSSDNITWDGIKLYTAATWTTGSNQTFSVPASAPIPDVRITALGSEILYQPPVTARITTLGAEVLYGIDCDAHISAFGVEVLRSVSGTVPDVRRRQFTFIP